MSESYKIHEDGLYYVTFAVVGWLDVFTRRVYQDIFTESIKFCQKKRTKHLLFLFNAQSCAFYNRFL